jgi:glycosyltransferase involved in cell wall biosynthesis
MKIIHLSQSDTSGGAARAAYRIHRALITHGIDSEMMVDDARADDWTVHGHAGDWRRGAAMARRVLGNLFTRNVTKQRCGYHSAAILPSNWSKRISRGNDTVLNLHWIGKEMISIADLGNLLVPVVWTLHDMWAFCGAEHYSDDIRWIEGYTKANRPPSESGFDLNRFTWQRKKKYWKRPFHIVAPSNWLADSVKKSAIMNSWPVQVIPHAIDTEVWKITDQGFARHLLNLPQNSPLLLFGAIDGTNDPRKGFDLLKESLSHLRGDFAGLELVIYGENAPQVAAKLGFPVHYLGHLYDDISICLAYNAANLMIVPSYQEAFGQIASEAQSCGCPVIAFNSTGLADVVSHLETGYLAKPFDTTDLAYGINWVLENEERRQLLSIAARQRALKLWTPEVVVPQYLEVYGQAIKQQSLYLNQPRNI